jgi:hypothetical protein
MDQQLVIGRIGQILTPNSQLSQELAKFPSYWTNVLPLTPNSPKPRRRCTDVDRCDLPKLRSNEPNPCENRFELY